MEGGISQHEQVSTTLDIYGHLNNDTKKETAETMGKLLVFDVI